MSSTSSDTESSCGWSIISVEGSDIETLVAEAMAQHESVSPELPTAVEAELQDSQDSVLTSGCKDGKVDVLLDDMLGEQTEDNTLRASEAGASDHSDIVTLQELREGAAATGDEGSFMGMSCSSQYTFTAAETVLPAGRPAAATNSSSSESETNPNVTVRRRRVRRSTANAGTESCEEDETTLAEVGEDQERRVERTDVGPIRGNGDENHRGYILLVLLFALSIGLGHYYGTMQERPKTANKVRERDLDSVRDVLQYHVKSDLAQDELNEQNVISLLTEVIKNMSAENKELTFKQETVQALRVGHGVQVRRAEEEKQRLTVMNEQLQRTLGEEEKSLSTLRKTLTSLRSRKRDLEAENRRLKGELERGEELKKQLDEERELASEAEQRLRQLEKRLEFEQQRSDMWERLYLETKDQRAKGDTTDDNARKPGMIKKTFDAVKNSTKDFVRHHKEQIKNAKEAVKENLRKFSDSVKSTFRRFKDSASTFIDNVKRKGKRFYRDESTEKKKARPDTRKSGERASGPKACQRVFDCTYQESVRDFDRAAEPVRADDVHRLLRSYLRQEVRHFSHWKELESFIDGFFIDGLFVHDRMLFADFVSSLERYLADMPEYRGLYDDVFGDVDDFIFRNLFGEPHSHGHAPRGPLERPGPYTKEQSRTKHQGRRQQRQRARHHSERRNGPVADVKIELGPVPLGPKY
ncbi:cell cycle progression protein 1 [Corythoichthys intestinalis]|uniref:cell cycle progression protein 1 n=1 Tax=Corythoichthys intestinalis TaxID=161448 RepID=UPI0025A640C5|nr:cell cycle progression protein 1 [Corythoichthys intestinalis]